MLDMAARRLNLSLPPHFDDLLADLSEVSGRSKASFVLDAVAAFAGHWQDDLTRIRATVARQAEPMPEGDEQVVLPPESRSTLSRQQRRRWEREQRKREKKGV
jgi:uncharacterized protein (DUF1778 family)